MECTPKSHFYWISNIKNYPNYTGVQVRRDLLMGKYTECSERSECLGDGRNQLPICAPAVMDLASVSLKEAKTTRRRTRKIGITQYLKRIW